MTDETTKAFENFAYKWAPNGKHKEFLEDLFALVKVAISEATRWITLGY